MMSIRNVTRLTASLLVGAGLLFWVGCDTAGDMSPGQGQFTLRLTDAPADVNKAVVTVERVDLVPEDAEEEMDDEDDADDADEEGVITLTDETRPIDLLELQGGVSETLADVTVPEGTYTQLRFVLGDENYLVFSDGTRQDLTVPSGQQTGIKIILPEVEIENDGDQVEVTLDFDVDESLVETGSGDYLFKPTINVKNVFVNGEAIETVEVEGAVSDASGGSVAVDGIPFSVTDQTGFDGDDGASNISALEPGLIVEVEGTLLDDGSLEAREVEVEDDDEVDRSITAPLESVSEESFSLLGVTIEVTNETEFDDDGGLSALEAGDRVEVEYDFQEDVRVATEVESEDDG